MFQRRPTLIQAWKVPLWGHAADEPVPVWLASRMTSGEVRVNAVGGLSAQFVWGTRGCGPGDYIVLTERDEIDFCNLHDFADLYEPVRPAAK